MIGNERSQKEALLSSSKWLKLLFLEEKGNLAILVIFGAWISVCSLIIPIAIQLFVNTISFGLLMQPILILSMIVFFVLLFSGAIRLVQMTFTEILQRRIFAKLVLELAYRIPRVKYEHLVESHGREWVNRFFDISFVQRGFAILVLDASSVILQVLFGMVLLAFYHPMLLGINLIILTVSYLFFHSLIPTARAKSLESVQAKYSVVAWLQELAENADVFRTLQSRQYAVQRADKLTYAYLDKRGLFCDIVFKHNLTGVVLQIIVSALLLGVGGWLVVKGQLTLGQLVASQIVVASVTDGIRKFGQYLENYYDMNSAMEILGEVLDLQLESAQGEAVQEVRAGTPVIKVKDLLLKHREGESKLKRLNFEIRPGSKVQIIGPSEGGRSRILQTLFALEDAESGIIEINGLDSRYSSLEQVRSTVSYISSIQFYSGTILDNLRTHNADAKIHSIQQHLKKVGLERVIDKLPKGINREIIGSEFPLPTPQSMKLMLVRALVGEPKVILIDGLVDKIDLEADPFMKAFISEAPKDLTLIFGTRRRDVLKFCDQVIVIEEDKSEGQIEPKAG